MGPAVGHVDRRQPCWHQQQKLDWLVYTLSRIQSVHAVSISIVVLFSLRIAQKYLKDPDLRLSIQLGSWELVRVIALAPSLPSKKWKS